MKPGTHAAVLNVWLGSNLVGLLAAAYQLATAQRDLATWIMLIAFLVGLVSAIGMRRYRPSAG